MPAPRYALPADELQGLLLEERAGGLEPARQAVIDELRRRGRIPPAIPKPEARGTSRSWGHVAAEEIPPVVGGLSGALLGTLG
ncbi:MAG: hypothetical protein L0027_06545, partial [Candidatus Rokubacteria bacterium]|nr:hypothetical protein [Candidatus Rokubacteria bacterium]